MINFRVFTNKVCFVLVCLFFALALIPFIMIVWELLYTGIKHVNLDFFTKTSPSATDAILAKMGGELVAGGILNGIIGSFTVIAIAVVFAVPFGVLSGIYIAETRHRRFALLIQSISGMMQGMPSLIIGVVVYLSVVRSLHSFSAFSGGVSLAIVMLPIITSFTAGALQRLPANLKEAGLALGGSYTRVMFKLVLPSVKKELISGVLIAVARALGETAPLILTILGTSMINWNVCEPTNSVSLLIWNFFNNSNLVDLLWSASLFLFSTVLLLNVIAKYITKDTDNKVSFYG